MIEALRTLVPYMVRYRWRYAAGFTALVLTVLTSATIPALIGYTVDELNRSFSMELDGDRRHGNTRILPRRIQLKDQATTGLARLDALPDELDEIE